MFTREMIADWMWKREKALLDELAEVVQYPAFTNSLYGRNGKGRNTEFGQCDDSATWNLCGYGSDQAILDMAEKHEHAPVMAWLFRKIKYATSIVPWWLSRFGKPCGEDSWHEPCHDRNSLTDKDHGDTDIQRHWDSFGLHQISIRATDAGVISKVEACDLALSLLGWIQAGAIQTTKSPREYLRYGNRINSLCGIYDVLNKYGGKTLSDVVWNLLKGFVYWAYSAENKLTVPNADGDLWSIYSYGGFKYDNYRKEWTPAFRYGWWPYGNQSWYVGHNIIGLFHTAERASWRGDFEFMRFVLSVLDSQTKWLDVTERWKAPEVYADDGELFHNSLVQGGLSESAADPFLTANHIPSALNPNEFKSLGPSDEFYRFIFVNHHEADLEAYHSTTIADPSGAFHDRTAYRYKEGYTGRPNLDLCNSYGCCDGVLIRALLYPTSDRIDWAYIVPITMMGYGNRSDCKVRVDNLIEPSDGVRGYNLIGGFNRPYHWYLQAGMGLRKYWIDNSGKPVMTFGKDGLEVFGQVMDDLVG